MPYGPLQEEEVSRLHAVDKLLLWLVVPHVKCSSVEFVICWQRQDEGSMYVGSIDVFLELVLLWHRPVSGDETVHHDGLLRREVVTAAVPRDEGIDTLFQHDTLQTTLRSHDHPRDDTMSHWALNKMNDTHLVEWSSHSSCQKHNVVAGPRK